MTDYVERTRRLVQADRLDYIVKENEDGSFELDPGVPGTFDWGSAAQMKFGTLAEAKAALRVAYNAFDQGRRYKTLEIRAALGISPI